MPRIFLTILLATISSSAIAEWVNIREDKFATVYFDSGTITLNKKSGIAEVWHLLDYKTPQDSMGKKYFSAKIRMGYNCKTMKLRNLGLTWHAENMGGGEKLFSRTLSGDWRRPLPRSLDATLLGIVCEQK